MPSAEAPNASPIDLNGTWTYASGPVDVVHKGSTITASYLRMDATDRTSPLFSADKFKVLCSSES